MTVMILFTVRFKIVDVLSPVFICVHLCSSVFTCVVF